MTRETKSWEKVFGGAFEFVLVVMGHQAPSHAELVAILNVLTTISVACGILTLWVALRGIPKVTTYVQLIALLTIYQLGFDMGLFLFNFAKNKNGTNIEVSVAQVFVGSFFGTTSSLFSLAIGIVLTVVVMRRFYFDLSAHINTMHIIIVIIGFCIAIPLTIFYSDSQLTGAHVMLEVYDSLRLFVIIANVLILSLSYAKSMSRSFSRFSVNPVSVLMKRLALYPVVQVVCRLPVQIYQGIYMRPMISYFSESDPSKTQTSLFIASVATVSLGGFGNLIIFMLVQPEARKYMKLKVAALLRLIGKDEAAARMIRPQESIRIRKGVIEKSGPNRGKLKAYVDASKSARPTSLGAGALDRNSNGSMRDDSVGSDIYLDEEIDEKERGGTLSVRLSSVVDEPRVNTTNTAASGLEVRASGSGRNRRSIGSEMLSAEDFDLMGEDELAFTIASAEDVSQISAPTLPQVSPPHELKLNFRGDLVVEMQSSTTDTLTTNASPRRPLSSPIAKGPSLNPSLNSKGPSQENAMSRSPSALTAAMSFGGEATHNPVQGDK